jgi:hypothetical protein
MNFPDALYALAKHKVLRRKSWGDDFIFLTNLEPPLIEKSVANKWKHWDPTQDDILAKDWETIED